MLSMSERHIRKSYCTVTGLKVSRREDVPHELSCCGLIDILQNGTKLQFVTDRVFGKT
jgi:hypothetical protein